MTAQFSMADRSLGKTSKHDDKLAIATTSKRHVAWVRRTTRAAGDGVAWRPKKVYRKSAVKFIMQVDNILRYSTAHGGLALLVPELHVSDDSLWRPSNWRNWPHMILAIDQGGDGVCGSHALLYKLKASITPFYEFVHGANNDLHGVIKEVKKFDLALICLVVFNLAHGPDKDEGMRHEQFQEMSKQLFKHMPLHTSALFRARSAQIIEEMDGSLAIDPDKGAEASLFDVMKDTVHTNVMGDRIKMCQFFGWWKGARVLLQHWSKSLFKAEAVCLEEDWLKGSKFMQLPVVKAEDVASNDMITSTSSKITSVEAKLIRSSCQNNVVTQVALLSVPEYRRQVAHMVYFLELVHEWQGNFIKETKDTAASSAWLIAELGHSFTKHEMNLIKTLSDQSVLRKCGYFEYERYDQEDLEFMAVPRDDEFATLVGDLVFGMVAKRQRRLFWATNGYPVRQVRALVSLADAELEAGRMFRYLEAERYWRNFEHKPPALRDMLGRSCFALTSTQQLVHAYEEFGWQLVQDITSLLQKRSSQVLSSVIVEHINNAQKNNRQAKGSMKYRRPERSLAVTIASKVGDGRYDYSALVADVPLSRDSMRLTKAVFGRDAPDPSIDVSGISSTTAKAGWFSPLPANVGVPGADLDVMLYAYRKQDATVFRNVFLSCACDYRHHIVIRFVDDEGGGVTGRWYLCTWHYHDSAGFGWPVQLVVVPGYLDDSYLAFDLDVASVVPLVVHDWSRIVGRSFRWRGVSFQRHTFPVAHWQPAIRAIVTTQEMPLDKLAALNGWWQLDFPTIKQIAPALGKNIDNISTLCTALLSLTQQVLDVSAADALTHVSQRLVGAPSQDRDTMDILLGVDEAASCLLRDEEEKLRAEQAKAREQQSSLLAFHDEFKEAVRERNATGPGPARKKAKVKPITLPESLEMIVQKDAKVFFPSSCLLWKSRGSATWHIRMKGWLEEKSRAIKRWGETRALKLLITEAWYQWSVLEGVEFSSAPVLGLFPLSELYTKA